MPFEDEIRSELAALDARGLRRAPPVLDGVDRTKGSLAGREVVVFCSNDYLGLAGHPIVARAMREALDRVGVGAGASRLISGTHASHRDAERDLADWVGLPAALLFGSGYAANLGALSAILGRGDVAFSDRLNHASLIDGLRLSRAKVHVFDHGDLGQLDHLLRRHRRDGRRALVASDSVFSMDGDLADLAGLQRVAAEHDAVLYVDEAHALGVIGAGRGACHAAGVRPDVLVGTLGKAVGVSGAFVAGSGALRALLENRARSYVFSTAPPPAIAQGVRAAVGVIRGADEARARVLAHAEKIRAHLRATGWRVPDGATPVVPVLVGDPGRTMALSRALLERGYFVQGIRPPTVPAGTSRLRVVPTAAHSDAEVEGLLAAFDALRREHEVTAAFPAK